MWFGYEYLGRALGTQPIFSSLRPGLGHRLPLSVLPGPVVLISSYQQRAWQLPSWRDFRRNLQPFYIGVKYCYWLEASHLSELLPRHLRDGILSDVERNATGRVGVGTKG